MSKTSKRKSGGESSKNKSLSVKDSHKRPSVFERLGTKASNISIGSLSVNVSNQLEFCRAWAQNGTCPYGKSCKLSYSHTLISPSKRSVKKEDPEKRGQNSLVRRGSPTEAGVDWESWDQSELEYEDEKALERRRQLLQRELELQLKKETQKQDSNKRRSSSTSSDSSTSSSSSSSSGSSTDSSVSTKKKIEPKIQSPSLIERSIIIKKTMGKGVHKESPPRKSSASKKVSPPRKSSRRKSLSPVRKQLSPAKSKPVSLSRGNDRGGRGRNDSPVASSRGRSSERKQARSSRRSPRPAAQRERRPRSPRARPPSRNRTPDRRKDDDRRGKEDSSRRNDRKSDFRDKRDAREKERVEALERCRERQRERDALAKERERKEREKRRRAGYASGSSSRRSPPREEKRHERKSERERSYSRERARDRALERVLERRGSSRERSYERPYSQSSPSYRGGGGERSRYGSERVSPDRGRGGGEERRGRRWDGREKREWSEHPDWESRSRCEERSDDWCAYSGPGNGSEWRSRSHLSHHDDRRSHHTEKDKDHPSELPKEKESKEAGVVKRNSGEEAETDAGKRARLEEVTLQEELSDISDDPDDILNREDEGLAEREGGVEEDGSLLDSALPPEDSSQPLTPAQDRNIDSRLEDDAIVSLDFEEISDEELEEESKSSKGVSVADALGVDWASLVAEWRPPRESSRKGSARAAWGPAAVFKRVGVSPALAGQQLLARITNTYLSGEKSSSPDSKAKSLPSALLQNKRALSARTDIIIRRKLCGLPVISSETHPTTGLCQWAV